MVSPGVGFGHPPGGHAGSCKDARWYQSHGVPAIGVAFLHSCPGLTGGDNAWTHYQGLRRMNSMA